MACPDYGIFLLWCVLIMVGPDYDIPIMACTCFWRMLSMLIMTVCPDYYGVS